MIRRIVLLVAFAALLPCLALAGGVSFSTTGTFSNPTLFPITFTGTSATNFPGGNFSFGIFNVGACPTNSCHGSETFTLTITETSPVSGTGDLKGKLSGSVQMNGRTSLTLHMTMATITIGSTTYTYQFPHSINFGMTTLNGNVTPAVPEPSAELLLGIGALGLMGLTTVTRKMISV